MAKTVFVMSYVAYSKRIVRKFFPTSMKIGTSCGIDDGLPDTPVMVFRQHIQSSKHSPEILTGIGIAGMAYTVVTAVKATPKALRIIEEEKPETKLEAIKATWKCYIPTIVTGVMSTACLIGANSVNARRNAALAAAYNISQAALVEYKDKTLETVGEATEQVIRESIAKDKIEKKGMKYPIRKVFFRFHGSRWTVKQQQTVA